MSIRIISIIFASLAVSLISPLVSAQQSTAIPQPGAQPAVSDAKARGDAYRARKQKQMYYDRLNAVRNEFWDPGRVMTAEEQAAALARMRRAMDEAKANGDDERYSLLQHAYKNMSDFAEWSKGDDQGRTAKGDLEAKKQLDELKRLEKSKLYMREWHGKSVQRSPLDVVAKRYSDRERLNNKSGFRKAMDFLGPGISIIIAIALYGGISILAPRENVPNRKFLMPYCLGVGILDLLNLPMMPFLLVEIGCVLWIARVFRCSWGRSLAVLSIVSGIFCLFTMIFGGIVYNLWR